MNAIKAHVGAMIGQIGMPRWGIITSVNPSNDTVKVRLEPESTTAGKIVESGWLPMANVASGGNFGVSSLPLPGAQAFIVPDGGDDEHGVVVGFSHSDLAVPPGVANAIGSSGTVSNATVARVAGEFLVVTHTGTVIRACDNGDVYIRPSSGTVGIDGTLHVNGDVFDRHGSLDRLRVAYDVHRHPGVQPGGGITGTTDHVDPE